MNKSSAKVVLPNVRCSYVYADKPNKHGKYSIQPLIEKDSALHKKLAKIQKKILVEAFGEAAAKKTGKFKLAIRDGDDDRDGEEYEGMMFFNANSGKLPGIVNKNREPADAGDLEELCYSGAYFNVSVNFYAFPGSDDGGKPGVAVGFNNLMLHKEGDRLDGSSNAESDFADFGSDDFDDDLDDL